MGGLGCKNELLNHGSLMQSGTKYDGIMLETCVSVTWMRLLRRMYYFTGDIKYIDEIERTAFNVLYGSVNFEKAVCGEETRFDEPITGRCMTVIRQTKMAVFPHLTAIVH